MRLSPICTFNILAKSSPIMILSSEIELSLLIINSFNLLPTNKSRSLKHLANIVTLLYPLSIIEILSKPIF